MDKNIESLIKEFEIIADKGWIESISKSTGSIGLTFEKELKKKPDNRWIPDYKGIEIKCTKKLCSYPIGLFSLAFDGPTKHETQRIIEKYGHYDKIYKNEKVLCVNINNYKQSITNKKYIFKLDIDLKDKKIYLCVYDLSNNLVEKESYINIKTMYVHAITKLRNMAIIYGMSKIENDIKYFKYNEISIYRLGSLEKFISALKNGIISAQLTVNVGKNGTKKGKIRNKNLTFLLKKRYINEVFDKVYEYKVNCNFSTNDCQEQNHICNEIM